MTAPEPVPPVTPLLSGEVGQRSDNAGQHPVSLAYAAGMAEVAVTLGG